VVGELDPEKKLTRGHHGTHFWEGVGKGKMSSSNRRACQTVRNSSDLFGEGNGTEENQRKRRDKTEKDKLGRGGIRGGASRGSNYRPTFEYCRSALLRKGKEWRVGRGGVKIKEKKKKKKIKKKKKT